MDQNNSTTQNPKRVIDTSAMEQQPQQAQEQQQPDVSFEKAAGVERQTAEAINQDNLLNARNSFSGRLLTDAQFDEAMHITQILEREIYKNGSFKDKLADYSYAFARSENLDARRMEASIRDLYQERTGQTMFQLCEDLKAREDMVKDQLHSVAFSAVQEIETMMEQGDKITFNRALAEKAQVLADDYGVKDNFAKKVMNEAFQADQKNMGVEEPFSIYDWGKQLDQDIYRPQIEQEQQARQQAKQNQDSSPTRSFSRR